MAKLIHKGMGHCQVLASPHWKPSRQDPGKVSNDFEVLHTWETPALTGVPSHAQPAPVADAVPQEEEIRKAVSRLHTGRSAGLSKPRKKEAFPEDNCTEPNWHRWSQLLALVQHCWSTGKLPQELTWTVLSHFQRQGRCQRHWTRGNCVEAD